MKFRLPVLLVVITAFLIAPTNSLACACCAEKGFYSISTQKPEGYTLEVLQDIKFAGNPQLYMDAAGTDNIKGLESLTAAAEDAEFWKLNLTDSFASKTWKLNFTAYNGKTGTLTLPIPAQMVSFKVDIHDSAGTAEPSLYKEWRFKGNVQTGNGIFQSGIIKPTTYFLVLQGRGNVCDNAEDFTHWRLEINGKKADYKFFGKLASGAGSMPDKK